jgi:monoamine oxidase
MGRESKVQVRYGRPFWRDAGLSGEVFDLDLGYLSLDVTRPGDDWATIVAFIGGKDYDVWTSGTTLERRPGSRQYSIPSRPSLARRRQT